MPEPDFLDKLIAHRTAANPEFPALLDQSFHARRLRTRLDDPDFAAEYEEERARLDGSPDGQAHSPRRTSSRKKRCSDESS